MKPPLSGPTPVPPSALTLATRAVEAVAADPDEARALAVAALAATRRAKDPDATSVAHRALGLAARVGDDAHTAARHLRAALRVAERHERMTLAAEARMSLALVLDDLGRPAAAVREIDVALRSLRGLRRGRAVMQRALILRRLGHDEEAMAGYRSALRVFRREGDRLWEARALNNRAILHGYHGSHRLAAADLGAAAAIYADLDLPTAAAQVHHNLGFVAAQAGDVPLALARYEQARAVLTREAGVPADALLDLAELLRSARLLPEAQQAAQDAVDTCRRGRLDTAGGEAALLLARVALARGNAGEARDAARSARRAFTAQRRHLPAARARAVELGAVIAAGRAHRGTLRAVQEVAAELTTAGWLLPGCESWLDAAQLALALGEPAGAASCLERAAVVARRGPAVLRARWWHLRAVAHLADGDVPAAARCADAGLREFEAHRASLGATELRVRSGGTVADLAAFRLRLAVEHEPAEQILQWSQRCRAAALWLPPARPSGDPVIARDLARLRSVHADLAAAPIGAAHTGRLLQRQRDLEEQVRRRSWQAHGTEEATAAGPPLDVLAAALGDLAFVDLLAVDACLHALVLVGGRVTHRPLGPAQPVLDELHALRFAQRRLVARRGHRGAATLAADHAAADLDRMLLAPLDDLIGDRDLVLAPTGQLQALSWSLLPRCRGRAVRVTPSAATWWRAQRTPRPDGPSVFVGAADPPQALREVTGIAAGTPRATLLAGDRALVSDVLHALDGASLGHIACHGQFRTDNALFSALLLADGPLTMYDLSALNRPPGTLVLSGCDTGLSAVHPGEELLGLTSTLLQLGTRTVVASTGPVDDEATRTLMTDFHKRLGTGCTEAAALAAAQLATDGDARYSSAGFVCYGAG
ncbi:CHAT domain-containing protein [Dactylosporangium sp. NPDC050588]|uniref:CHAT domain-containing protein n=1 Tax=Dactylosporangium sp. NPDC050588 TaxID=3157211 RepID=UPI0033E1B3A7